jgi:hypothetical protein
MSSIRNWRALTRNNGQTANHQKPEFTGPFEIRTSAKTRGYYRTSSPVTALPMIMRWISDVPSKIVKLVEVRAVSAGRWPISAPLVSTNSAPRCGPCAQRSRHGRRRPLPYQVLHDASLPILPGQMIRLRHPYHHPRRSVKRSLFRVLIEECDHPEARIACGLPLDIRRE